jgi:hypothetical protein
MAVEARRGCGFRKTGGYYLVGGGLSAPCDRIPYALDRCRTCGGGVKFTRGHAWLQPDFFSVHGAPKQGGPIDVLRECADTGPCPVCLNRDDFGPHLLLWVGRGHYTPQSYMEEAGRLGVSRRLSALPKGLVIGETWVLLAHLDAMPPQSPNMCADCGLGAALHPGHPNYMFKPQKGFQPSLTVNNVTMHPCETFQPPKPTPGIFCAFVPRAVELILKQSDATPERIEKERKRGVTVVAVPDDDPDHQGSVWDGKDPELSEVSS